ncbi:CHASE2 domain-containing protein [Neptuniibacter halophilus]|uniref:CHASE2 domain-containing protein n=1 Tax=Neptuniibacter halophilus TaxID=651666 RepID=UPI00257484A9|nr:CHASE2 domain-containing protein [Neptuniibacter halophilus]
MGMNLTSSHSALQRLLGVARGRPLAIAILLIILLSEVLNLLPQKVQASYPQWFSSLVETIRAPTVSAQLALFDSYQQISPRQPLSQPVTVVAIDEKTLVELGQWPWPRDILAKLIHTLDFFGPAAIGLDFYMPEPDQNSVEKLAQRLAPDQKYLIKELESLPSSDFQLAMALSGTPSVLAAAGFDFDTYTTSSELFVTPIQIDGTDPSAFLTNYPQVLASLPELQYAAAGQALVSIPGSVGPIRHLPLIMAVNGEPVPNMVMEMFRVATASEAIRLRVGNGGIEQVSVADLNINTQAQSDVWLHYASLDDTRHRYVSAVDVLNGQVDPSMLENKLVLIGLTGAGLSDMRFTPLNEQVPGVEIHAQLAEAMFDGDFLYRPVWLHWLEVLTVLATGMLLIWFIPRPKTQLGALLKHRPVWMLGFIAIFAILFMGLGYLLFWLWGLLFSASSVVIGITLVMGSFFITSILENLGEAQARLERLVENGIALGRLQDRDTLLQMTLDGIDELAPCQAQVILLKSEDGLLTPVGQRGLQTDWEDSVDLTQEAGQNSLIGQTCVQNQIQNLGEDDHRMLSKAPWAELRTMSGSAIHSLLVVPMQFSDQTVKGVVLLLNAVDPMSRGIVDFESKSVRLVDALASQAAVAIENQDLVAAQKHMMDAMIKMIAGAIDAKSAYTGGHCERVPELAVMLCKAASAAQEGPLAEFAMTSKDEWREFNIAAWLHDCGKVTTPEHVVDKATKLETIYNRIHEVRTRFEVLLRDAEIAKLQAIYEQQQDPATAKAAYAERRQQLLDDFAFIAHCNVGGEFLEADKIERIREIGQQRWQRNFDNRIGLSDDELRRCPDSNETLPVMEPLLCDRPEHLIERPPNKALDPEYGWKMEIPEYLYNHGELHNLVISRGTLTPEERFKINEHIIQTIAILEQMPFPPNLRRVPEIAGAHHETLIGTGYPRGLSESELSVPARIMAIADIFEALTASDRPYKKAKSLSESIRILSFFKKDQHIDPVLFDLFLSAGIYKQYAERFLDPEQIDEVDIEQYLG